MGRKRRLRQERKPGAHSPAPPPSGLAPPVGRGFLVAVYLLTFIAWLTPIDDNDYGLHLRLGADIASAGRPPSTDHHSFTADGAPYPDHEWIPQLLFFELHSMGGDAAMVVVQAALTAAAVGLAAAATPGPPLASLSVAALVVFLGHY